MATIIACTPEELLYPKRIVNARLQKHREHIKQIEDIVASGQAAKIDLSDEADASRWVVLMNLSARKRGIAIRKQRGQPLAFAVPLA